MSSPPSLSSKMTLGEVQEEFSYLLAKLIVWVYEEKGWRIRMGEGMVALTDSADGDYDGPHKEKGGHYRATAQDLNLFVRGIWLRAGNEPEWEEVGKKWESLDPLCRWGGHWGDANHFGLLFRGTA